MMTATGDVFDACATKSALPHAARSPPVMRPPPLSLPIDKLLAFD